jgi:hypothetical protein
MNITKEDIQAMSVEERRQLLEMLWESFEQAEDYIDDEEEESEEEMNLLRERLEGYQKNQNKIIDAESFLKNFQKN